MIAAETLVRCRNAEDWETLVTLMRPQLLVSQSGTSVPSLAVATMSRMHEAGFFGPIEIQTIGEPSASLAFGSINLTVRVGFVLHRQEWLFALEQGAWLLNGIVESLPVFDVNAVGIPITLDVNGLSANRALLTDPGAVVFDLVNTLDQSTSFAVFSTSGPSGSVVRTEIIQGIPPDAGSVIGWIDAAPGETGSITLVDLPAGAYLIAAGYDPRLQIEPVDASRIVEITIED